MTLAEFLLARIAAEEFIATEASRGDDFERHAARGELPTYSSFCQVKHIRTWSPARVLAECEAKRRIVARCARRIDCSVRDDSDGAWELIDADAWATLYDLALPHADHPDYREEWRP